jgi:hypothetical protein
MTHNHEHALRLGPISRTRICSVFLVVIFSIIAAVPTWGQFDSASVLGNIKDPAGSNVSRATVALLDLAKGVSISRSTDADGNYEFTNVQPGGYSISVNAPGFERAQTDLFTVNVGARQRVSLTVKVGADAKSITVS